MSNENPPGPYSTPEELALAKKWLETWKRAGPELERIRREEIRKTDTPTAVALLAGAFESARFMGLPQRPSSGLVEQQRLFKIWRQRLHGSKPL